MNHVGLVLTGECVTSGGGVYFKGDDRSFSRTGGSHRTQQLVTYRSDPQGVVRRHAPDTGETRSYAADALADNKIDSRDEDGKANDCKLWHRKGTASTSKMKASKTSANGVRIHGGAGNPLVPAVSIMPEITWDYTVDFGSPTRSSMKYALTVKHDCYPAYEVYIGDKKVYTYSPSSHGAASIALCLGGITPQVMTTRTGSLSR